MSNFVPHRRDPAPPTDTPSDPAEFAPETPGRWTVSTRSVGELLTTDIRGDQLRVLLFSRPDGQAHFAVRIASLLDTAVDTADQDPGPHEIPPLLIHTMQVVVELIQDLTESTGEPASAVAFYGSAREAAFAHAGGATVEFDSTQGPIDVGWVSLSDPESGGTLEVRAFSMLSRPDLDVSLRWSYSTEDSGLDGVEVDAQWQGPSHVAVQVRTLSGEIVSSARAVGGSAGRGGFFAGWFEDLGAPAPESLGSSAPDPAPGEDEDEPAVYDEHDPEGHRDDDDAVYDEPEGHDATSPEEAGTIGEGTESEGAWEEPPGVAGGASTELPSPESPSSPVNVSGVRVNLTTPAWEWPPRFPDLEGPVAGSGDAEGKPVPEATAKSAKPEHKPVEPVARAATPPPEKPSRNAWRTHYASRRGEVSGERVYEIPNDDDPVSQGATPTAEPHVDPEPDHRRDPASRGVGSTPDAPAEASHDLDPDSESHRGEAGAGPPRWSDEEEVEPLEPEPADPEPAHELEPAGVGGGEPDLGELAVEPESLADVEAVEDAGLNTPVADDDTPAEAEPAIEPAPYVTTSAMWNVRDLAGGSAETRPAPPRAPSPEPSVDEAQAAAERAELLRRMGSADLMKLRQASRSESGSESAEPVAQPVVPDVPLERESVSASAVSSTAGEPTPAPAAERPRAFMSLEDDPLAIGTPEAGGATPGTRVPRAWPAHGSARRSRRAWMRHAPWAATLAVLFGFGWWIGVRPGAPAEGLQRSLVERTMIMVGLGGPRYTLHVSSLPLEAKISVDGRPTSLKTPADLEVKIGPHRITLTVPDYGEATFSVTGEAAQRVVLEASLSGSLQVLAPATGPPIEVTLDGIPQGYAPLRIMQLDPGPHDVEFAAPGQPTWAQTVRVPVRGNTEVTARPFELPPTGLIEVRATFTDDDGTNELKGATVFVDGERRGVTPLSLELTRGPHSVRASYRSEMSSVQVLDLPGGNQRYASFSFGLGSAGPRLELDALPASLSPGQSITLSSKLTNIPRKDLREMWLHVRSPEGTWRRYAMTMLESPLGTVGVVVFPLAMLDHSGQAVYYVSALSVQGEEYFTDLQTPKTSSKTATRRAPRAPERPDATPPTTAASSSPPTTVPTKP